jgi:hypothetical protein
MMDELPKDWPDKPTAGGEARKTANRKVRGVSRTQTARFPR